MANYLITSQGTSELQRLRNQWQATWLLPQNAIRTLIRFQRHRFRKLAAKLLANFPRYIRTPRGFRNQWQVIWLHPQVHQNSCTFSRKENVNFFFRHLYGQDIKARINFQRPFQATESQVSLPSQCRRPLGVNTKCKPGDTRYSLASIRRLLEKRPRIYDKSLSD